VNTVKTADELLIIHSSTNACCGTSSTDGTACSVPQNGQPAACGCQSDRAPLTLDRQPIKPIRLVKSTSRWQNSRSGVMFAIACIASPCCTPLIVPVLIALLGGTPIAAWMGRNLGMVYGGLTVLSVISLLLALRWMKKDHPQQMQPDMRKQNFLQPIK